MNLELKKYKNYKELCQAMEWEVKAGKSKQLQIKDLERYCKYHKQGNSFFINEIYDEPLPKEDLRGGNNKIYADNVDKLILNMMAEALDAEHDCTELSTNGIMVCLNIINRNYSISRNNMEKFSNYLQIPIQTLNDFYNSTYKKNKDMVEAGLNRLENKYLIAWNKRVKVYTLACTYREANDMEIREIKEIEQYILKDMKLGSKQKVFMRGKWKEFSKKKKELLREKLGFNYDFEVYHIITTTKFKKILLAKKEKNDIQAALNKSIKDSCIKSAEKRHNKIALKYRPRVTLKGKRYNFGMPYYDKDKNRLSENYVRDIEKIVSITIDRDCKIELEKELKNIEKLTDYQKQWIDLESIITDDVLYDIFG